MLSRRAVPGTALQPSRPPGTTLPPVAHSPRFLATGVWAQCRGMMTFTDLASVPADPLAPFPDQLRLAVAAYLARFTGSSRQHTESDLRCYLSWCAQRGLDPLAARRPHLELYIRWMQEIRHFKPSTVSRAVPGRGGCPQDLCNRRPARAPTGRARPAPRGAPGITRLGVTHLQFEALLTAARNSTDPCDFALVAMLGLHGLRIFEATAADITDLGEEHGHRVLRVCGKGAKVVLIPLPPAVGRAIDQAVGTRTGGSILLNTRRTRMDPPAATRRLRRLADTAGRGIPRAPSYALPYIHHDHAGCGRGPTGCPDRRPARRAAHHDAPRPGPQEPRPPP